MKLRIKIALLGCLAFIGVALFLTRPSPAAPQSVRFVNNLKALPESLRARATGKPVQTQMHTIESDLIDQ